MGIYGQKHESTIASVIYKPVSGKGMAHFCQCLDFTTTYNFFSAKFFRRFFRGPARRGLDHQQRPRFAVKTSAVSGLAGIMEGRFCFCFIYTCGQVFSPLYSLSLFVVYKVQIFLSSLSLFSWHSLLSRLPRIKILTLDPFFPSFPYQDLTPSGVVRLPVIRFSQAAGALLFLSASLSVCRSCRFRFSVLADDPFFDPFATGGCRPDDPPIFRDAGPPKKILKIFHFWA